MGLRLFVLQHVQRGVLGRCARALHHGIALQVDTLGLRRLQQQPMQICTMKGDVRGAVRGLRFFERQGRQHFTRVQAVRVKALRESSHLLQRIPQTPCLQNTRHIGPKLHTGAHL
ncbi:MAG: hypothetical protein RL707_1820 [Pseudomonadota bacterium]